MRTVITHVAAYLVAALFLALVLVGLDNMSGIEYAMNYVSSEHGEFVAQLFMVTAIVLSAAIAVFTVVAVEVPLTYSSSPVGRWVGNLMSDSRDSWYGTVALVFGGGATVALAGWGLVNTFYTF